MKNTAVFRDFPEDGGVFVFCLLRWENSLKYRQSDQPEDDRSQCDGRKIVGDLDLCNTNDIGSECDDDQGTDTSHFCDRR